MPFRAILKLLLPVLLFSPGLCGSVGAVPQSRELSDVVAGKNGAVTIDLVGLQRCMFGDLDALLLDLRAAHGALSLQMTVESIGSDSKEIYYGLPRETKTAETNLGSYDLTLPASSSAKIYGVFLCSIDERHAGSSPCSEQMLKSPEEILRPYRVDSGAFLSKDPVAHEAVYSSPKSVAPTLYYSQFFVRKGGVISVLENSNSVNLGQILADFGIAKGSVPEIANVVKRYSGILNSLPLVAQDGRLQIQLPFFSQKKCLGE